MFLSKLSSGSPSWSVDRTETYAYDADFDYLTSVDYNDGLANEVQSWGYDAAGNRVSDSSKPGTWTYDNLNRMSGSPKGIYLHDAVGNRTQEIHNTGGGNVGHLWDSVNRMTYRGTALGSSNPSNGWQYQHRADGMRVSKRDKAWLASAGTLGMNFTGVTKERKYYDGQMPVEETVHLDSTLQKLTRNFVGG